MDPATLGPYRLDRELGSGGMGKVWAATVERETAGLGVGTTVAVKVVHPHLIEGDGFFQRFLREARIGREIEHPNVVRTFDCGVAGDRHYLVLEYVAGGTLADLREDLGSVPEELCRHVAREICRGLTAIHAAGAVHRDLKPENVLLTPEHQVKLMDLGVALLVDERMRLSQTGAFVGSVDYAAPEQFRGEQIDARTDLHALGVLLYELSTGAHPFRGGPFHEVLRRILTEQPRPAGELNPQLSPFFEEMVHTLLVKDPRGRFASTERLQQVLERCEESEWWRRRSRALRQETARPLRRIRIPRETAVYGRDDELARLRALFDLASSGEGQVVLVSGEAGIGKSRLVDELVGLLQREGEDIDFLFGGYPPGGAASAAGGFLAAFREHLGEQGSSALLSDTPLLAPAFDAALRGDPAPPGAVTLTKDALDTCFVHATRGLASVRPTVLLIDDLHFAPDVARDLFVALALAVPGHRVLLVGTARPSAPQDWVAHLARLPHATRVELARLGAKDLGRLLEDAFASRALADELGHRIAMKSDGNPFFAFEIIRGLREGRLIRQTESGDWVSTRVIDDIEIPSSVLDLVNARVAGLDDDDRNLLDVAACWGFEFDASLVGEALGLRRLPVLQAMAKIEKRDRLVRSIGRRFAFDHHQVQEALYEALPEMLREEYHGALAEALEERTQAGEADAAALDGAVALDLCRQYLAASRGDRGVRYLDAALDHLAAGYRTAECLRLARSALAAPGVLSGVRRAKVLLRLSEWLDMLARRDDESKALEEALAIAEDGGEATAGLHADAARRLGWQLFRRGRIDAAEPLLHRALAESRRAGAREVEGRAVGDLGAVAYRRGDLDAARAFVEQRAAIARELGNRAGEAGALGNLGLICQSQGRYEEARDYTERQLVIAQEIGDRRQVAQGTGNLGNVFHRLGDDDRAIECYDRQLALARQIGDRWQESQSAGNRGGAHFARGELAQAEEAHARHLALTDEVGDRGEHALALINLAQVDAGLGRPRQARDRATRALAILEELGLAHYVGFGLQALATAHAALGDEDAAHRALDEALRRFRERESRLGVATTLLALGSRLVDQGRHDGARRLLDEALSHLGGGRGLETTRVLTLCHLALLPGGDEQAARDALARDRRLMRASDRMQAHLLLWRLSRTHEDLVAAHGALLEALSVVPEECHADMLENLAVHREVASAWAAAGGDDDTGTAATSVRA